MMKKRLPLLVWIIVLPVFFAMLASASAGWQLDPLPGWWPDDPYGNPDGVTRAQYHSFMTDPNLNLPPDWTYDGFQPSVPDNWTTNGIMQYQAAGPGPDPFYFGSAWPEDLAGDDIGAYLIPEELVSISKLMGNLRMDDWEKEYYVLAIWAGEGILDISVDSQFPNDIVTGTQIQYDDAGYHATILEGLIIPQPDWETFTFDFMPAPITDATGAIIGYETLFIDSIYIGTHCVPEPGTVAMLIALAGLAFVALRRRK
jgi:PEP-CTERM motif